VGSAYFWGFRHRGPSCLLNQVVEGINCCFNVVGGFEGYVKL
jgi:hypothetical protein